MQTDVTLFAAFVAGFLSFVSPCVLPLVPPYLGFMAGATIEEMTDARARTKLRVVGVSLAFIAGFATVFISLGATASVFGRLLNQWSQVLGMVAGAAIIVMGLHFLGVFRIAAFYREARFTACDAKAGPLGAYVMGLAFAFGWTPCIGPILAAILSVAGSRETVSEGVMLLATYSAGLGVPFLIAALFAAKVFHWMARFRAHFGKVEKAMGALLVVTGVLFLTGGIQRVSFFLLEAFPQLSTLN